MVAAPVETVWRTIKALDFQWWKLVASATPKDGAPLSLGSTYKLAFKDGQQWTIALMEASEINRSITFEVRRRNFLHYRTTMTRLRESQSIVRYGRCWRASPPSP